MWQSGIRFMYKINGQFIILFITNYKQIYTLGILQCSLKLTIYDCWCYMKCTNGGCELKKIYKRDSFFSAWAGDKLTLAC